MPGPSGIVVLVPARLLLRVFLPIAVVAALAAGLLPPLLDQAGLDTDALNAARAGSAVLVSTGSSASAEAAAQQEVARDPGVVLVGVRVDPQGQAQTMEVSVSEKVHTFMDGLPGLEKWFVRTSSAESSVGT